MTEQEKSSAVVEETREAVETTAQPVNTEKKGNNSTALILSAVDISGRGGAYLELPMPTQKVGTFDTELCAEFWIAFARDAGLTLHIRELAGSNSHHIIEGTFKAVARSLRAAVAIDPACAGEIPSTKGVLA